MMDYELPEELRGDEPPIEAREWADWAYKHTQHSHEEQRTLDWMAREGGGEKLAQIADEEQLPAAQVRQRVSRLRRLMRRRWMAELAAVAAVGALVLVAYAIFSDPSAPVAVPTEPSPAEPTLEPEFERARQLRAEAERHCARGEWSLCREQLDEAKKLHPAGENDANVVRLRKQADENRALEKLPEAPAPESSAEPSVRLPLPVPPTIPPVAPKPTSKAPPLSPKPMLPEDFQQQKNSAPLVLPQQKKKKNQ